MIWVFPYREKLGDRIIVDISFKIIDNKLRYHCFNFPGWERIPIFNAVWFFRNFDDMAVDIMTEDQKKEYLLFRLKINEYEIIN